MARRTVRPPTWLALIRGANAIYTGDATVEEDVPVDQTETSFRGGGHRVTVSVTPLKAISGPLPDGEQTLTGDTQRGPDSRLGLGEPYFPPDSLRELPYWDFARHSGPQRVLVLESNPPAVKALENDDALPAAVAAVQSWTALSGDEQKQTVLKALNGGDLHPVAYVAAFELLAEGGGELGELVGTFAGLEGIPAAAMAGIAAFLPRAGASGEAVAAAAKHFLGRWDAKTGPEEVAAYLTWFDAERARTWESDSGMRDVFEKRVKEAAAASYSGPDGESWTQEIHNRAASIRF